MKLYGRKWRILIMDKDDKEALNISDMRVVFNIRRAREVQNYSTVSIYNLSTETERSIIMNGDRIVIEAGYEYVEEGSEDQEPKPVQYGLLFDGKIIYPSRQRENNVNFILSLLCVDGQNVLQKDFISKTVNRGLNQRQVLDAICENSQTPLPQDKISEGLSQQKLPRGKVFFGATKSYVADVCRGNAATFNIENGKLNVHKLTDKVETEAIVVTPQTGLIGMPSQTQFGADFTLLLRPDISIACLVQLKNSEISEAKPANTRNQVAPIDEEWIYQIVEYTHVGDTRGNEWYTKCTGISRYGKGSLAALMANAKQNAIGG